jgi:hypothetical protein
MILQEDTKRIFLGKISAAEEGNPIAAIESAMLLWKFPIIINELRENISYNSLLDLGMRSTDPEVLVDVGEMFFEGHYLKKDFTKGMQCFAAADRFSPFMGAFMIARIDVMQNRPVAMEMLEKATRAGHVPSEILLERKKLKVKNADGLYRRLKHAYTCGRLVSDALSDRENLYSRFWRYKDVVKGKYKPLEKALPVDRKQFFKLFRDTMKNDGALWRTFTQ